MAWFGAYNDPKFGLWNCLISTTPQRGLKGGRKRRKSYSMDFSTVAFTVVEHGQVFCCIRNWKVMIRSFYYRFVMIEKKEKKLVLVKWLMFSVWCVAYFAYDG